MSLRFVDGFDHYDSARLIEKWDAIINNGGSTPAMVAPGRFGYGQACIITGPGGSGGIVKGTQPGGGTHHIIGAAFNFQGTPTPPGGAPAIALLGNQNTLFGVDFASLFLGVDGVGHLYVMRNDEDFGLNITTLGVSAPGVIPFGGTWFYLEMKSFLDAAAGTVAVRLNGLPIPSLPDIAGVRTQTTGVGYAADSDSIYPYGGNILTTVYVDDLYFADASGAHNNDFLGPIRIQTRLPVADGFHEDWAQNPAQGAGGNWKNVNQNPPDDDATYQSSATPAQIDTYTYAALVSAPTAIKGVQTVFDARKDDAGGREVANLIRGGGADFPGPTNWNINDSYRFFCDAWDVNPATANPFSVAEANAVEAGYKEIA